MPEPSESASSELLTFSQVAEYLGVCRAHVYMLIKSHPELKVIRLGRLVRIHKETLRNWLTSQEQEMGL